MSPSEAKLFLMWVMKTLPGLLPSFEDPLEALQELGEAWKRHRTHHIANRDDQIRENRTMVDNLLQKRMDRE